MKAHCAISRYLPTISAVIEVTILCNTDILDNGAGEFEDTEEVFEAVGEVLQGISEKSEKDIR